MTMVLGILVAYSDQLTVNNKVWEPSCFPQRIAARPTVPVRGHHDLTLIGRERTTVTQPPQNGWCFPRATELKPSTTP